MNNNHSLSSTEGISMSQAQSLSNILNQECESINQKIGEVNNCSKTISVSGKEHSLQKEISLTSNILDLLEDKALFHACQGFLMENIKAKDKYLKDLTNETFSDVECKLTMPEYPMDLKPIGLLTNVSEEWGFNQLTKDEMNEYIYANAMAAHIGQFIHKNGKLDSLRKELPTIKEIEWMEIKVGEKEPVIIKTHHTIDELTDIHIDLANKHRTFEQKVNYYKSKVKNLVNDRNAEIHKDNKIIISNVNEINNNMRDEYQTKLKKYHAEYAELNQVFEKEKCEKLKEISQLRIVIDERYKSIVGKYLDKQ